MAEIIKTRLKFFFLSFFHNKTATTAKKLGFFWVLLSLLLSFLFVMLGYYGSSIAPFSSHYDGATKYTEFIDRAFVAEQIQLRIDGGTAKADRSVNTFIDENDKTTYALNGYSLIVDTRPSDTPIVFTQVAKKGDKEIPYSEYRVLGDDEKKLYKLVTKYTGEELSVTAADAAAYEEFLKGDADGKAEFDALDKTADDYGMKLYAVYVKHYYEKVQSIYRGATVPVLRDYYYSEYVSGGNSHYFYLFDDMCAGSFMTDGGVPIVFGGYFQNMADGNVKDVHRLIKDSFYDSSSQMFGSYFFSAMSQLPTLIIIPIIFGLIVWGVGKLVKDGWEKTFGGCYKIVNSFVWMSALVTSLVALFGGWLTAARTMYMLIPLLFGGILLIRIAIYCIMTAVDSRKNLDPVEPTQNEIFGGIS